MTSPAVPIEDCPTWCPHPSHDQHTHQADVGGMWLRELRTGQGGIVRAAGGLLSVGVVREVGKDDVIRVERAAAVPGSACDLTSGEARQLAALLLAGADRADGLR